MEGVRGPSNEERGQSLVELAVVFMLLMLILAGVADLGRAFFTYIALRDAAQEGAAYGTIYRIYFDEAVNCAAIEGRTRSTSNTPVDLQSGDVQVDINLNGTSCGGASITDACVGREIMVLVRYDNFPLVTPFLGSLIGSQTIPISASVKDTILTPPCPP
jgi:Flp pilus assembly protein TadG